MWSKEWLRQGRMKELSECKGQCERKAKTVHLKMWEISDVCLKVGTWYLCSWDTWKEVGLSEGLEREDVKRCLKWCKQQFHSYICSSSLKGCEQRKTAKVEENVTCKMMWWSIRWELKFSEWIWSAGSWKCYIGRIWKFCQGFKLYVCGRSKKEGLEANGQ